MHVRRHTETATDADAVELLLSRDFITELRPSDGRHGLTVACTEVGPLSLGRAAFDMTGDLRGRHGSVVGVARVRTGHLTCTVGREALRQGPGDLFVAVDPASEYVVRVEDVDVEHTMVDLDLLAQVAEAPAGQSLRLTGRAPVSARAAATWIRTWGLVSEIVADGPQVPDLVVGQASRLLATVTLAAFPNNAVVTPDAGDRRDAHPAAVRRAISLMETHPDLDLTVVDIARGAYVSTRALQLAFRRHLDTTPMTYLRRVRLDRARADLLAAVPGDGTTVTGVAARWGWTRSSRFAVAYQAAYGRSPSQDLAPTDAFGGT